MAAKNVSLKTYTALEMKEQVDESTLASLETEEMLALLYEYNLPATVKKAIVDYLLEARMEDEQETDSSKWMNPDQFKALPENELLAAANLRAIKDKFLVTLLIDEELTDRAREAIYRQLVSSIRPADEVESSISVTDTDRVYPALNIISTIFKVVAGLIVVVGIIIIVLTLKAGYSSIASAAAILLYAAILAILAYASAELIRVLTDISSTTYKILNRLNQDVKK